MSARTSTGHPVPTASYLVKYMGGPVRVVGTHFRPGYSAFHGATPIEAVDAAIAAGKAEILTIADRLLDLQALRARLEAEASS